MDDRRRQVERQLYRRLRATCDAHSLLEAGDRVMVAVSGGKDSYTLAVLLHDLVARSPDSTTLRGTRRGIELTVVHLDQGQPGYDGRPLEGWLRERGFAFEILREDTFAIVTDHVEEGGTYCSLCSRLRRGILYTAAERLGCNKIALGHHREDALETFLLNLFFSGKLQAMPATYTTDDGRFQVIRPLIECPEPLIAEYAALSAFPILPCNLCGSQPNLQRDAMTRLIDSLEATHPDVRSVMAAALGNVVPSHLLDRDLSAMWNAHRATLPSPTPRPKVAHAAALPVSAGQRRLPLVSG